jgi:polyisoprenoid-binding protein YceI
MTDYLAGTCLALLSATALAADPVAATTGVTPTRYTQAPGGSLTFVFSQAGAASQGSFGRFDTELRYDPKKLAQSTLRVTVHIASLDTQDKDRDTTLAGADLFDAQKFPTATYTASSFAARPGGADAIGKLTLRGVTRDLRLPLTIKPVASGIELSGEVTLKRLDYGIGQGEWKSTEWVGDDVTLKYRVTLAKAAG